MSTFQQMQEPISPKARSYSPHEAFEYAKTGAVIVDIRPEYETSFRVFDVPRVIFLQYSSYRENVHNIPRDCLVIVADSVGNQSKAVAEFLLAQGYEQVGCLAGGIVEWDRDGLPLAKDIEYEMVGGCACRLHPQKPRLEGSVVGPKQTV